MYVINQYDRQEYLKKVVIIINLNLSTNNIFVNN